MNQDTQNQIRDKLRPLPQPGLIATVDKWITSHKPNPTTPK
jgi:hypothetical protein